MYRPANRPAAQPRIAIRRANDDRPSGDCARVFLQRHDVALCFLADVAGHDAEAARLAGELEALVSATAHWMAPGSLLSWLNSELEAAWPPDLFVSAVCLSFDSRTGRGTAALAGQLPPVVRGRWTTSPLDVTAGPPLGVLADQRYPEGDFGLGPGDLLVAVTDGITDPLASAADRRGLAALARLVDRASADLNDVCASLLRASARPGVRDDATVLALAPVPHAASAFSSVTDWPVIRRGAPARNGCAASGADAGTCARLGRSAAPAPRNIRSIDGTAFARPRDQETEHEIEPGSRGHHRRHHLSRLAPRAG